MFHSLKINKQSREVLIKGSTGFTNTEWGDKGNCKSRRAEFLVYERKNKIPTSNLNI